VERFWIKNFGCRASQADGAAIGAGLTAKGLVHARDACDADLLVLNTCTVTSTADDEVRQVVRRLHRERPDARILITGCYAQRAPEELAAMAGVSLVVGNSHKTRIPELVSNGVDYHGEIEIGDIFERRDFLSAPIEDAVGDRTRPNLKIQDGCNNRCSFCIIPFVRGRSRSGRWRLDIKKSYSVGSIWEGGVEILSRAISRGDFDWSICCGGCWMRRRSSDCD
jgi:threonylcarbamoyladenosine tRNA methylthiotransferase MtaB